MQTEYTGVFGVNTRTVYYLDGEEYTGETADTVTWNGYTMSAGTYYAPETLKTFTRTKSGINYVYTNVADSSEYYSATSASGARNNILASHSGYTLVADGSDMGYAWVFKALTSNTVTEAGNSTVTVSAAAVSASSTGSFKVAALNVDGMPQTVSIASVYDLKLNEDGPGADGSTLIGQYIQNSGIDVLALSEDFNFFSQINAAAPSYATMTQREQIPTSVGLGDLNNSLFPFDTDGLNLMYKSNLSVSSESMTAWNEHYSPTTNYVVIDVPDQNGADGMIDKGFRFYQVQFAPGVVVDVYILHMDAETDPGDNAARASQIDQLMEAVEANDNGNPVIIMGDTNCRYTRDPLETKIIDAGFSDPWIELERGGVYPQVGDDALMVGDLGYQKGEVVDKVFYKNVEGSPLQIEATSYFVDAAGYTDEGGLLGDHPPVIVTFSYSFTANTVEHTHDWAEDWTHDAGYHWHECRADGCDVSMNSLKDGYAEHSFTEKVTTPATCEETGVKTLTCSVCGYSKTEVIPNTGHTWDEGKDNGDGTTTYTCTVCGDTYTEGEPTAPAHSYTVTVEFDKDAYNVGDTAQADIYVSSEDEGAAFATLGLKLNVPAGLTLNSFDTTLQGGTVSKTDGNLAYNVNSETPVAVSAEGVKVATATFTVTDSFEGNQAVVTLTLSDAEVTEANALQAAKCQINGDTATLYKTCTVTFQTGEHVTFADNAATEVTVRLGTPFKDVTKPTANVAEHYTFLGWFDEDGAAMTDERVISGAMTLTAKAAAAQFAFKQTVSNAQLNNLTGVTDGKAAYGQDITFTVTPDTGYVLNDVTYTVNGVKSEPLTPVEGTYTIPGSAITAPVTVEVNAVKYHTVTFQAGDGVAMTDATAYVKDGQTILYTDTDFDTLFAFDGLKPAAQTGYRLAADTAAEPLWNSGETGYTTETLTSGSAVTYSGDMTFTA